ncbi:helix-turn-helix domain-containing protein [Rhizobium sp. C4]|uniref:AraC-like ligand-binding domain-containing protein n=1 Tax=Rhizobium sp. C4 TaxID=1349800 RepID=UPI001E2F4ECF|nr:helix-turn-helix domain-containing protein [Rhizobium sp. C4]MCD2173934.1 helix-turn-helix domain-containing protein [Rhizobium sp. C4]
MTHKERAARLPFVQIGIGPGMPEPLEAARQIVRLMFDLDAPTPEIGENFEMNVTVYDLGPLQISTCRSSGSILRRTPALVALTRTDHFIVQFYRRGSFHTTIEGTRADVPAGSLAFLDLTRPSVIEADRVDNLALTIPPDFLIPLVADPHSIHGLVLRPDSEANVTLTMHLEDLWQRLPTLTPAEAQEEAQSLCAMLAAVIGAHAQRRSMARAHLRKNQFGAICRWIDGQLGDPALEPAAITRKFYITRPTLYRMFEQRGGIMKYILERRLEKVFHDLVDKSRSDEKIGSILHRWGLQDHTSAGRAFRSYFGVTPRQVRASMPARMNWPPRTSTEAFRIDNIDRLGPLLEKHNVRVTRDE